MSKSPAKIIKATASSPFMKGLQREHGLTNERITEIAFDFVYGGTELSLADFATQQAKA